MCSCRQPGASPDGDNSSHSFLAIVYAVSVVAGRAYDGADGRMNAVRMHVVGSNGTKLKKYTDAIT